MKEFKIGCCDFIIDKDNELMMTFKDRSTFVSIEQLEEVQRLLPDVLEQLRNPPGKTARELSIGEGFLIGTSKCIKLSEENYWRWFSDGSSGVYNFSYHSTGKKFQLWNKETGHNGRID